MCDKCNKCYKPCVCDSINQIFLQADSISNQVLVIDFSHFIINKERKEFSLMMNHCSYSEDILNNYSGLLKKAVKKVNGYQFFDLNNGPNKFIGNIHNNFEQVPVSFDKSVDYHMKASDPDKDFNITKSSNTFNPNSWLSFLSEDNFGGNSVVLAREFFSIQSIVYLILKNPINGFEEMVSFDHYHQLNKSNGLSENISILIQSLDNLLIGEMLRFFSPVPSNDAARNEKINSKKLTVFNSKHRIPGYEDYFRE